jgi:hypothetical protein
MSSVHSYNVLKIPKSRIPISGFGTWGAKVIQNGYGFNVRQAGVTIFQGVEYQIPAKYSVFSLFLVVNFNMALFISPQSHTHC